MLRSTCPTGLTYGCYETVPLPRHVGILPHTRGPSPVLDPMARPQRRVTIMIDILSYIPCGLRDARTYDSGCTKVTVRQDILSA
jgi:hypothetical protein